MPTQVGGVHNAASTFKPYDPSRVKGDTPPNMPMPKGDEDDCGGFGSIIVMIVQIVVTVVVAYYAVEQAGYAVESAALLFYFPPTCGKF